MLGMKEIPTQTANFDVWGCARSLQNKGLPPGHAEAVAHAMNDFVMAPIVEKAGKAIDMIDECVATKEDIKELRAEMKEGFAAVKQEFADVRSEMKDIRNEIKNVVLMMDRTNELTEMKIKLAAQRNVIIYGTIVVVGVTVLSAAIGVAAALGVFS